MADKAGGGTPARKRNRRLTYFFLNGLLHKSLHINRGADIVTTWCYPEERRVAYTYSDVKKRHETAYTSKEVSEMIGRGRLIIEYAIRDGHIEEPQYTYGIDEHKRKFQYMWAEKNILELHAYFSTVHRGRPRKDGMITPQKLPTERELRAMIRQEQILYVRDEDGEFKPVWRAQDFS